MDPYAELGVDRNASPDDIRRAYKKLALKLHPDKNPGDAQSDAKFRRVAAAYAVLNDPDKRARYDATGRMDDADTQLDGVDLSDIFGALFMGGIPNMPGFGVHNAFHRAHMAHSPRIVVGVTMKDVLHGCKKTLKFDVIDRCGTCGGCGAKSPDDIIQCMQCEGRGQLLQQLGPFMVTSMTCPSCAGVGRTTRQGRACTACNGKKTRIVKESIDVAIPKGAANGHEFTIDGVGNFDQDANGRGNVIIHIAHERFEHEVDVEHNVIVRLKVSLAEVLCGLRREIDICGEKHVVESDGYFDPTKTRILTGVGLPKLATGARANLMVSFDVLYDAVDVKRMRKCRPIFERLFGADTPE